MPSSDIELIIAFPQAMHLLILLNPHERPATVTCQTRSSLLKLSILNKQSAPVSEQAEVHTLEDDPSSRWSTDTDDRGRFQSMFKGGKDTPVGSVDGHDSHTFGSSEEGGSGGWFMGKGGPLRRAAFGSVGSDSIFSIIPSPQEETPASPDWTAATLSPFQFGVDFSRYPLPPLAERLSFSQPYSPHPQSSTPIDHLLTTPPRMGRRRSLSYPPMPAFPCPPPRAQSRRSATAPSIFRSQCQNPHTMVDGEPFATEDCSGDGQAGERGAPNEFGIEEIGVARG